MKNFPGASGLVFDEDLLINQSSKGICGISIPDAGLDSKEFKKKAKDYIGEKFIRKDDLNLPEVSEPTVVRHFTRLSSWNISLDSSFYPLGSCTMKYNPKINELIASFDNIKNLHPLTQAKLIQPILKILYDFNKILCELTGFYEFTLSPQAGAAGEFTGMKIIRKYFNQKNEKRNIVLIPDSAHGTNPASSRISGFTPVEIKTSEKGYIEEGELKSHLSSDVAALMITNPNTFGIFEKNIKELSEILHKNGSILYMDGANFNAFIGNCKISEMGVDILQLNLHKTFSTPHGGGGPGSGPVGVREFLSQFLPVPYVKMENGFYNMEEDKKHTIGRVASFYGNFSVILKAYAYILSIGKQNIPRISELAILNANYIKKRLRSVYKDSDPFLDNLCMHECVLSDKTLQSNGLSTLDLAKLLIDYGFHPPTVYFPKNIHGAIMIEPTETESIKTMDKFISAMKQIKNVSKKSAAGSPKKTKTRRVNEVIANKNPIFKY
jgi:glycine dehydrogenase subunit 2